MRKKFSLTLNYSVVCHTPRGIHNVVWLAVNTLAETAICSGADGPDRISTVEPIATWIRKPINISISIPCGRANNCKTVNLNPANCQQNREVKAKEHAWLLKPTNHHWLPLVKKYFSNKSSRESVSQILLRCVLTEAVFAFSGVLCRRSRECFHVVQC